jgi:hypothetical protein
MSNPTSNFGWQMPTSTDLVTDLPADFEVFGQAVDTDFVDLLGGTTGQILSKTSATDLDFTWVSPNPGDITGVTAGTGITGGGTSGDVTITNDMATTITAAGDIVVGTGSGTYDNLPIGTTAQVLTADTTVSPYKVKWATPASAASFVGVKAIKSATQSLTNNTDTAITFAGTDTFDTNGFHDPAVNNTRFTIPAGKGGYYLVTGNWGLASNPTGNRECYFNLNGSFGFNGGGIPAQPTSATVGTYSFIANLSVADYIEMYVNQTSGGALNANTSCVVSMLFLGV